MITYIFYTKDSPSENDAKNIANQLAKQKVETKIIESGCKEGTELCNLYNIVSYPGIVITNNSGELIQSWQYQIPSIEEIIYIAHS